MPRKADGSARHRDAAYFLPRHPSDIDRLDIQHYAARALLKANYLAPLAGPASILDVGSGSGQWGHDLGAQFPEALVIGLDLVPSKPAGPSNYRFVRGNLLQGLPFAGGRFDFVHQRLLVTGVPVKSWPAVVGDLARVTRPGGWVELVEPDAGIQPAGPDTARLFDLLMRVPRSTGLDSTGIVFRSLDGYLRRAGLHDVERRQVDLPVGEWGGQVGSLMASDLRVLFTVLAPRFEAMFGLAEAECRALLRRMLVEVEDHHSTITIAVAFGRKPL